LHEDVKNVIKNISEPRSSIFFIDIIVLVISYLQVLKINQ
jgi:hypothetical protein